MRLDDTQFNTLLDAISTLRLDIAQLRQNQQRMMKHLREQQQEMSHRLTVTRDLLGALLKASHSELLESLEEITSYFGDNQQRLDAIEHDMDLIFDDANQG
jgi:serine phosphatase RsbU (regulator of sigma subunit)